MCALVDGCIKSFPEAKVVVTTPYYNGEINVAVIPTALHELVIGNDACKLAKMSQSVIEPAHDIEIFRDTNNEYCGHDIRCNTVIFENSRLKGNSMETMNQVANEVEMNKTEISPAIKYIPETNKTKGQDDQTIPKVTKDTVIQSNAAVQTRMQAAAEKVPRPARPMKVTKVEGLNITATEFRKLQEDDDKLSKYWSWAKDSQTNKQ